LLVLEYFVVSVSTSMGTKRGCIYVKGALFKEASQTFWGGSCPKLTSLDPPLTSIIVFQSFFVIFDFPLIARSKRSHVTVSLLGVRRTPRA